jgi:hypothetical protein
VSGGLRGHRTRPGVWHIGLGCVYNYIAPHRSGKPGCGTADRWHSSALVGQRKALDVRQAGAAQVPLQLILYGDLWLTRQAHYQFVRPAGCEG